MIIVCLTTFGFSTNHASAQTCYRLTDITELGFSPVTADDRFSINGPGEVVGSFDVNGQRHALLWLPLPNSNYDTPNGLAFGVHDLSELSGTATPALARDINDAGTVVGQAGGILEAQGDGIYWDLTTAGLDSCTLTVLPNGTWTRAFAVSDALAPLLVGEGDTDGPLDCDDSTLAFFGSADLADCAPALNILAPLMQLGENASFARDISTPSMGFPFVAGFSWRIPTPSCLFAEGACAPSKDAVVWELDPMGTVISELPDLGPNGSEARRINDVNAIVGWGFDGTQPNGPCNMNALFWDDPVAMAAVNLGETMPPGQAGDASQAEGINNSNAVVGWNIRLQLALLWENVASQWQVTNLTDALVGPCSDWTIRQAFSINDFGWIVAIADTPEFGIELHVVVLTPDPSCCDSCLGDIDCDGSVGNSDLLILLANFGPCVGCAWDLDCNGMVSTSDLITLFANWGSCAQGAGGSPSLQQAVQTIGFANVDTCCAWLSTATENEAFVCGQVILTILENQQ